MVITAGGWAMAEMKQQVMTSDRWADTDASSAGRTHLARSGVALCPGPIPRHRALLTRIVEADVIPRLVQTQRVAFRAAGHANAPPPLNERHVIDLVALLLDGDSPAVEAYVVARSREGRAAESLCLDLLSPAARHLGELWEQDICDFAQVSLGLHQLHRVLCSMHPAFDFTSAPAPIVPPRALLVPMPGEQHSFGLAIVVQFLRRAGWHIWSGAVPSREDLLTLVRSERFAVIGLSLACADRLDNVAVTIRALRAASRNRAVAVMVGGPAFAGQPALAGMVGADATARDGREAVHNAAALLCATASEAPKNNQGAKTVTIPQQLAYTPCP